MGKRVVTVWQRLQIGPEFLKVVSDLKYIFLRLSEDKDHFMPDSELSVLPVSLAGSFDRIVSLQIETHQG